MSLKKLSVLVFTLALLFSIQPTFAYHSSSYPETNLTIDQIKNHSYSLRVYENADTVFSFSNVSGTYTLEYGLAVWEHASWRNHNTPRYSSNNNSLYSPYVLTSRAYLNAWKNMRNDSGPIEVESGYRMHDHNKAIGGVKYSQHQAGFGVDPRISDGRSLTDQCSDAKNKWGFKYCYEKNTTIHADTRWTTGMLTVREGDENPYVWTMEDTIHWHGYDPLITGYFSSFDTTEVKEFQTNNGLTSDGIVGSNTWDYLMR